MFQLSLILSEKWYQLIAISILVVPKSKSPALSFPDCPLVLLVLLLSKRNETFPVPFLSTQGRISSPFPTFHKKFGSSPWSTWMFFSVSLTTSQYPFCGDGTTTAYPIPRWFHSKESYYDTAEFNDWPFSLPFLSQRGTGLFHAKIPFFALPTSSTHNNVYIELGIIDCSKEDHFTIAYPGPIWGNYSSSGVICCFSFVLVQIMNELVKFASQMHKIGEFPRTSATEMSYFSYVTFFNSYQSIWGYFLLSYNC